MSYAGLADPAKRADVVAYLRNQADTPAPLPAK
jgi:cytochrome c2